MTIDGFTISGASYGISIEDVSPTITNNTITGNSDGIYVHAYDGTASATISNNTITDSLYRGIYVQAYNSGGTASATISNNTITGSSDAGIWVYAYDGTASATISNNTIADNTDDGIETDIAYNGTVSATVKNTIVWGNSVGINRISGTVTVSYSDIQGGITEGVTDGGNNINEDPLFGNTSSGYTYDLKFGSPCLNTGTSDGAPSTDILGRPRPNPSGSNPDMGAYEQNADASLAVELSMFTASASHDGVAIAWRTESEIGNIGFSIYRSEEKNGEYTRIALVSGAGNSAMPIDYQFADKEVEPGKTYFYYLEDIDVVGEKNRSQIIKVVVPSVVVPSVVVPSKLAVPSKFALLPNFPNPFNPETWIPYELASDVGVKITIYNLTGQPVRTLELGSQPAGYYHTKSQAVHWDGKNAQGELVGNGLYFYHLTAGEFHATKRMLLLK